MKINPEYITRIQAFGFTESEANALIESQEQASMNSKLLIRGLVAIRFAFYSLKSKALEDKFFRLLHEGISNQNMQELCQQDKNPDFLLFYNRCLEFLSPETINLIRMIRLNSDKPWEII